MTMDNPSSESKKMILVLINKQQVYHTYMNTGPHHDVANNLGQSLTKGSLGSNTWYLVNSNRPACKYMAIII